MSRGRAARPEVLHRQRACRNSGSMVSGFAAGKSGHDHCLDAFDDGRFCLCCPDNDTIISIAADDKTVAMNNDTDNRFVQAFRGRFHNMLRWEQLEHLWEILRSDAEGGWYLYAIGEAPPENRVGGEDLLHFIEQVDELLRAGVGVRVQHGLVQLEGAADVPCVPMGVGHEQLTIVDEGPLGEALRGNIEAGFIELPSGAEGIILSVC